MPNLLGIDSWRCPSQLLGRTAFSLRPRASLFHCRCVLVSDDVLHNQDMCPATMYVFNLRAAVWCSAVLPRYCSQLTLYDLGNQTPVPHSGICSCESNMVRRQSGNVITTVPVPIRIPSENIYPGLDATRLSCRGACTGYVLRG